MKITINREGQYFRYWVEDCDILQKNWGGLARTAHDAWDQIQTTWEESNANHS